MTTLPFLPYLDAIADAYDGVGEDPGYIDVCRWRRLAADSVQRAASIKRTLDVFETDDDESYPDAQSMCEDIALGTFVVSRANCEHPVWSPAENVAFRTVHDVLGHYVASLGPRFKSTNWAGGFLGDDVAGFDWRGENRACAAHFPLLGVSARIALFTECIAQTGFAIARGGFGPQKVGCIRGVNGLEIAIDRVVFDGVAC